MAKGLPLKIGVVCSSLLLVSGYIWHESRSRLGRQSHSPEASTHTIPSNEKIAQSPPDADSLYPGSPPGLLAGSKSKSPLFTLPIKHESYVSGQLRVGGSDERFTVATTRPAEGRILLPGSKAPVFSNPVNYHDLDFSGESTPQLHQNSPAQLVVPESKNLSAGAATRPTGR